MKYLHGWSYRQTAAAMQGNSLVRWFVGYGLQDETLDHLTLWRFAGWVRQHAHRCFFDETLRQIDQALPSERAQAQIGDTFALLSCAHEETRTQLLRNASRRLLHYLTLLTPAGHAQVVAGIDVAALFGTTQERPERYLEKSERDALEIRTATAAHVDIFRYLEGFYNRQRRHSTLGYLSPMAFEQHAAQAVIRVGG